MSKRPDLAEIYERAAERLESHRNEVCCGAIWQTFFDSSCEIEPDMFSVAVNHLEKSFKPANLSKNSRWFDSSGTLARTHRITALLLMAEMARQGDL